eukprot:1156393-Pelagomonas_calceolata.AAC.11
MQGGLTKNPRAALESVQHQHPNGRVLMTWGGLGGSNFKSKLNNTEIILFGQNIRGSNPGGFAPQSTTSFFILLASKCES